MADTAQITAAYGRHYTVRTDAGTVYTARTRSKRSDYACGDFVRITALNDSQAVIENVLPRQSLLYRQDAWKSKLIAANVGQIVIVTAAVPAPNEALLQRALIAAEAAAVPALIVANKTDLPQTAAWLARLSFYQSLGYALAAVCARDCADTLRPLLHGKTNILLGASGVGKSTLTNALLGSHAARTGELSAALASGKHTTTHAQLYDLDSATKLIDAPGLQAFGLHHLDIIDLPKYFPEMHPLLGQCRFHNCRHRAEPACALKTAAEHGHVRVERLALLQQLTEELS
ncbi:ribosome small subunit-dependent GTPase A [Conchiformibius kuhniae]|uniref:Small ribosomal subunit biogenesis GTPase RsgA n=1 Tax=Conchiformibius kuhniae TaxID=211502 RepID=A0ABD8B7G2_9NEIS|nr:ribosome small subunit-dependent GTPase A [Conchiformibius kuhniae]